MILTQSDGEAKTFHNFVSVDAVLRMRSCGRASRSWWRQTLMGLLFFKPALSLSSLSLIFFDSISDVDNKQPFRSNGKRRRARLPAPERSSNRIGRALSTKKKGNIKKGRPNCRSNDILANQSITQLPVWRILSLSFSLPDGLTNDITWDDGPLGLDFKSIEIDFRVVYKYRLPPSPLAS